MFKEYVFFPRIHVFTNQQMIQSLLVVVLIAQCCTRFRVRPDIISSGHLGGSLRNLFKELFKGGHWSKTLYGKLSNERK